MSDELYAYKPIRVLLSGDKAAAKRLVRSGQVLSGQLDKDMSFQGLKQGRATKITDDYTITVTHTFNERKVEIEHVPSVEGALEPEELPQPCSCALNFAECYIIGITEDENDSIPEFCDHDEYCVCYDIMVCAPDDENADIDGFVLWERVRPSDFTRYEPEDIAVVVFEDFTPETSEETGGFINSACGGFSANQMDPDNEEYIHPVIIPLVTKDEYLENLSYKPLHGYGIIPSDFDTQHINRLQWYLDEADAPYCYITTCGYKRYSTFGLGEYIFYPVVRTSTTSGISCSVHELLSADDDSDISSWGDSCNLGTINYRNRGYDDSWTVAQQLAGGSFAFDQPTDTGYGDIQDGALHLPIYGGGMIVGHSHLSLGYMPTFITGETVARKVLRPATKWLMRQIRYRESGVDLSVWSHIYDIRTGLWSQDVWEFSGDVFSQLSQPSTYTGGYLDGYSDDDLSLFRQMFPVYEFQGYGGSKPMELSPEMMDSVSFDSIQISSVDVETSSCSSLFYVLTDRYYASGYWMSADYSDYISSRAEEDLDYPELIYASSGDWEKTLGIQCSPSDFYEAWQHRYDVELDYALPQHLSNGGDIYPPMTYVQTVQLCWEGNISVNGSPTTVETYTNTSGDNGNVFSLLSGFYRAEDSTPQISVDDFCEAASSAVGYAVCDIDEEDIMSRYSLAGIQRYRSYQHYSVGSSVGTDVGTQFNDGNGFPDLDSAAISSTASTARWGYAWKNNFLVYSGASIIKTPDGSGGITSQSSVRNMTGCYYPLDLSVPWATASIPIHACRYDVGYRAGDKTITSSYTYFASSGLPVTIYGTYYKNFIK